MIQLSRNYSLPEREDEIIPIKVIGVGGAGSNALDRVVLDGLDKADLIVANTDAQALASSVAAHKVQLGRDATRGLGAGGDPQLGHDAGMEAIDELRQALQDARMIFICAGLGGGTGSGAAPIVAELAREAGALVITFATMPFPFEGKRRAAQAEQALARLQEVSDAVICFENEKMGDIVAPKAGVHQAFAAADVTISQSVRAIVNLIQRPGLIRIGFDDLVAALRASNSRCLFGFGESDSDNRAHDALTQALKNPLMDRGRLLADAGNVLVQVAGGPGMTLSEVEILMQELNRHVGDETQILFGTGVDGRMGNRMTVTLISSLSADGEVVQKPLWTEPAHAKRTTPAAAAAPPPNRTPPPEPVPDREEEAAPEPAAPARPLQTIEATLPQPDLLPQLSVEEELLAPAPPPLPPPAAHVVEAEEEEPLADPEPVAAPEPPPPPPPRVLLPRKKVPLPVEVKPVEKIVAKQEVLQFESVTRGRFEKSEPTIVEGQDLDVPTFLRKNVRVK
ncbi:MAG: cell division protein FtsZ [Chthoniobacterales bacterium]|nr:cell division protein FtsZ [Chthoniobacterales bacterium]